MNKLILTKQTSEIDTINLLSDTIQLTVKYDNFRKLTLTYHLHSPGCIAGRIGSLVATSRDREQH